MLAHGQSPEFEIRDLRHRRLLGQPGRRLSLPPGKEVGILQDRKPQRPVSGIPHAEASLAMIGRPNFDELPRALEHFEGALLTCRQGPITQQKAHLGAPQGQGNGKDHIQFAHGRVAAHA